MLPTPYYDKDGFTLYNGDCLAVLRDMADESINACVTSPPYWGLRDYGGESQIGLEETPQEYVTKMVEVFREVRRVLRGDGTLWLNLGDSYANNTAAGDKVFGNPAFNANRPSRAATKTGAKTVPDGLKPKDLVGIPWRVAFALQEDGWYLRQDIIWHKPNPMPESVTDRCTKAHEYVFLLTKSARYYYDAEAIAEPSIHAGAVVMNNNGKNGQMGVYGQTRGGFLKEGGVTVGDTRNRRTVWKIATKPFNDAHFAVMPTELVEPCIKAGCPPGGVVFDPFMGAGTVAYVARNLGCKSVGAELNPDYCAIAVKRLAQGLLPLEA